MPRSDTRDTLVRQWELLKMLPTHDAGRTVTDLANSLDDMGLHTSRRTVERDLHVLKSVFTVDCNDDKKPHGWPITRVRIGWKPRISFK